VLSGWAAAPARFREDANAEEDAALGGYRDRLVIELAQNAADAASGDGGAGGRLLLRLDGEQLTAANTGRPLDADGVQALSTLRASAKRDDLGSVGRFGVGFAAVLAVTDEPLVASRTGAVGWSAARTREEVGQVPALAEELARRGGQVPVLRLPYPSDAEPPPGFDTVVVLPLRAGARRVAERLLDEVDAGLLLMLPALAEVAVEVDGVRRTFRAADLDVRSVEATGRLDPQLLADRPTEERAARQWWVRWAAPLPAGTLPVLHAPTPTDEPLDLPALLLGSFPLAPDRRHVAPGPLRDFLVQRAADAYAELVAGVTGPDAVLALVPGPVGAGPLDAELRRAIVERLADAPVLPGGRRPGDAVAVDGLPEAAYPALAEVLPGLLPPEWAGRRELDRLGVRRMRLADLVDDLAALDRPPSWWHAVYEGLAGAEREALSGLPVPLADGRLVRGPRGVVLDAAPELAALGLRVVHPQAAHPLLERLGALPARPEVLLDLPAVRAAVAASLDADDPEPVAAAVLGLVADGAAVERPWLAELAVRDDEGGWSAAGELLLPDAPLAQVLTPDALGVVDPAWADRFGATALAAVGCLSTFALVVDADLPLTAPDHDLDAEDEWADDLLDALLQDRPDDRPEPDVPPVAGEFVAVRDLDLVDPDRWPQALRLLAGDPGLRAAVVTPVRLRLADGRSVDRPSYTAWWLARYARLDGQPPSRLRAPGSDPALGALLAEAPDLGLDADFLAAIGMATRLTDVVSAPMMLPLLRAGSRPDPGLRPDGEGGSERPVPGVAARVLAGAPATYREHDDLRVAGVPCDWWVDDDGTVHAATVEGLARGLAWAADRWERRLLLAAVLADPDRVDELLAEAAWDD
jgi:hypothetical protein